MNRSNKDLVVKYLEAIMRTKNAHINALMYKKEELKDLQALLTSMESLGVNVEDLRKKYNA